MSRPDAGRVGVLHAVVVAAVVVGVLAGLAVAVPYARGLVALVQGSVAALSSPPTRTASARPEGPGAGSTSSPAPPRHTQRGQGGAPGTAGTRPTGPDTHTGSTTPTSPITGAVRADVQGIVRIVGVAPACSVEQEGSGFVVSPDHVLTNAHVVHGLRAPRVQIAGTGYRYRAHVVFYDPGIDVAVLDVPGLPAQPLPVATVPLPAGSAAVAAGFPLDGPLTLSTARIQRQGLDAGPAVGAVPPRRRAVYELSVVVRPGNSGGPLVTPDGRVAGIIFARSSSRTPIGFAITSQAALADVRPALAATQRVSTGTCG